MPVVVLPSGPWGASIPEEHADRPGLAGPFRSDDFLSYHPVWGGAGLPGYPELLSRARTELT
jgi:hypothetical protein